MDFFLEYIPHFSLFFIVLLVFYLLLKKFSYQNTLLDKRKNISENQVQLKLCAYERMMLFLERIEPVGMLNRLALHDVSIADLSSMLIKNIIAEYEYNVSQQIYVSSKLWKFIEYIKNNTINNITSISKSLDETSSTDQFVQEILKKSQKSNLVIQEAKKLLKHEVDMLL